jgi:Protein of unknown function (DUF1688)
MATASSTRAGLRPASITVEALPGLAHLRTAAAVRERCRMVHDFTAAGHSVHFTIDKARLAAVAAYVAEVTREAYPDLEIPFHSRWRHFAVGGVDRWRTLQDRLDADPVERARAAVDLATVSVLLDAGAGDAWRYREPATGMTLSRSEGLAVASLDMFSAGGFSSGPDRPWRADDAALERIGPESLARHFQVEPDNPLVGLEQRSLLLRRLGAALGARPDLFGRAPARPGNLVDHFLRTSIGNRIPAATVLATLLDGLSSIWPSGLTLRDIAVGDAGRHPAVRTGDDTDQVVPFHKLSQWLTYSLLEPIEDAGLTVTCLDELTALPEYRNGGLLIDLGMICPRRPVDLQHPHEVSSEIVVEWRALTVALMDQLLEAVRHELGLDSTFTMPQMLQGGTWSAGRKIALALRPPSGPSPLPILADGTVF